uniref:CD248 molecule, endosialin a n=1 Tax=Kryptolebias marmoratus TaxID=37003 RepID=A0A3Q2ZZH4_KRYMA
TTMSGWLAFTYGCFVVYFERKIFLDSWRSCKAKGGNLATIKRKEDAGAIVTLFSTLDLRQSHTKVQVWIGLQRQPRQCSENIDNFKWLDSSCSVPVDGYLCHFTNYTSKQPTWSRDVCCSFSATKSAFYFSISFYF